MKSGNIIMINTNAAARIPRVKISERKQAKESLFSEWEIETFLISFQIELSPFELPQDPQQVYSYKREEPLSCKNDCSLVKTKPH